jgi:hypothetical protein
MKKIKAHKILEQKLNNSNGINNSYEINNSDGINYGNGVNNSDGINDSEGINDSNGINYSEGITNSNGINYSRKIDNSHGINNSYGINNSSGINSSDRINNSRGINNSMFIENCNGVSNELFNANKKKTYKIFNRIVTENRFNEVIVMLRSFNLRPDLNNSYKLKKEDAYKKMPEKMLMYIRSLPEFNSEIFFEITGVRCEQIII